MAAMTPFISTPAAATIIMGCGCTYRLAQAMNGRDGDPDGDQHQRHRVEKRGQHTRPLISKSLLSVAGRV